MATKTKATSIMTMKAGKPTKAEKAAAKAEPEKVEVKMMPWWKRRRLVAKLVKQYETNLLCLAADCKDPHMKPLFAATTVAAAIAAVIIATSAAITIPATVAVTSITATVAAITVIAISIITPPSPSSPWVSLPPLLGPRRGLPPERGAAACIRGA